MSADKRRDKTIIPGYVMAISEYIDAGLNFEEIVAASRYSKSTVRQAIQRLTHSIGVKKMTRIGNDHRIELLRDGLTEAAEAAEAADNDDADDESLPWPTLCDSDVWPDYGPHNLRFR